LKAYSPLYRCFRIQAVVSHLGYEKRAWHIVEPTESELWALWYIYCLYAQPLSSTCVHPRLLAFMIIPELLSISLHCLAVWIVWKVINKLLFVSDIDNIPGAPSDSYLKGKHCLDSWYVLIDSGQAIFTVISGPMPRIFTKKSWKIVRGGCSYRYLTYFFSLRRTDCKYQVSFLGIINFIAVNCCCAQNTLEEQDTHL